MNPIKKAMDEIKFRIPSEILTIAFGYKGYGFRAPPTSIDESMMNLVIRPRVLIDADLVGGMMVIVPLDGIDPEFIDNYSLVYKIPDERVLNRTIVSILSIGYMPYSNGFNSMGTSYGNIAPTSINDVASVTQRLADSYASVPPISNAVVDLIGHNTVVIRDQYRVSAAYQLRCIVGNEENLNNINPRSYHMFAKLCELAIKSFIYKEMIIQIDKGYLQGGQELGIVKTYIEGLADSEDNYQTFLKEKWKKIAFMNDVMSYDRFIKLQCNPAV
jgi:hypothetical protein